MSAYLGLIDAVRFYGTKSVWHSGEGLQRLPVPWSSVCILSPCCPVSVKFLCK